MVWSTSLWVYVIQLAHQTSVEVLGNCVDGYQGCEVLVASVSFLWGPFRYVIFNFCCCAMHRFEMAGYLTLRLRAMVHATLCPSMFPVPESTTLALRLVESITVAGTLDLGLSAVFSPVTGPLLSEAKHWSGKFAYKE